MNTPHSSLEEKTKQKTAKVKEVTNAKNKQKNTCNG